MADDKLVIDTIALKKIMVEKRLSKVSDLSRISGIHRDTIANILNGKRTPTHSVMYQLVKTLDIPSNVAGDIFFNHYLRNT